MLTTEEHIEAHKLLYSCYNYKEDKAAYQMLSGLIKDGQKTIWTLNQEKMKREKKGFFHPKIQKDLANRPKKARVPRARNEFVIQALYRGIILEHQETKTLFEFFDYVSVIQIATELISHPFLAKEKPNWDKNKFKSQTYIVQGLTKLITGNVSTDGKKNFSISGFRVLGIRIKIE